MLTFEGILRLNKTEPLTRLEALAYQPSEVAALVVYRAEGSIRSFDHLRSRSKVICYEGYTVLGHLSFAWTAQK